MQTQIKDVAPTSVLQSSGVLHADVEAQRPVLTALAFRMLGTVSEAEDAVQDTYVRWYRLSDQERDAIDNPHAWMTRVASRVCLDVLRSARKRREHYVGPWLPEPLPAQNVVGNSGTDSDDPVDRVTLDESVSTALLVVLEAMTPAERVAFVLHDVFAVPFEDVAHVVGRSPAAVRQLAVSGRRRVESGRIRAATRAEHAAVVRDFAVACDTGDFDALTTLLDPAVVLHTDGGGVVTAARRSVSGANRVARFLLGITRKRPDTYEVRESADGLCLVSHLNGEVRSVTNVGVSGVAISDIWSVLNPAKLSQWTVR